MSRLLKTGDIFELKAGHEVYCKLPVHFVCDNRIGVFNELAKTEVTVGEDKNGMNTDYLKGRYVVIKTSKDGGGTGHGAHDVYPAGHHVFAKKVSDKKKIGDEGGIIVTFYQTGCFTAMIPEVEVIGKAKFKYEIESIKEKG